ncbi:TetR/AcrR family transcriptional regulator [Rarobacter incanus]|uniref:TetR family transcriptional regulator n=1 Tax=Rarobacter incanus TaxID=153494 RepID=A0A542SMR5_9MICO|nr:TetR/AcrR family transcriptional regulator [Rarobacter incanus]TQK75923.1 TetR family transcriptional regulator [Rarobacter incanus]
MSRSDTRDQILNAAAKLFAENGYTATSVDDIASKAGVAKGSVFYNFGSKSNVIEAVLDRGVMRLGSSLAQARRGLSGQPALAVMVREMLAQIRNHTDFAKILAAEVFRVGRQWEDSVGQVRASAISQFSSVISEMRPDLDADLVAGAVFGSILVTGLEWVVFQPDRSFDDVQAAIDILVAGLERA